MILPLLRGGGVQLGFSLSGKNTDQWTSGQTAEDNISICDEGRSSHM